MFFVFHTFLNNFVSITSPLLFCATKTFWRYQYSVYCVYLLSIIPFFSLEKIIMPEYNNNTKLIFQNSQQHRRIHLLLFKHLASFSSGLSCFLLDVFHDSIAFYDAFQIQGFLGLEGKRRQDWYWGVQVPDNCIEKKPRLKVNVYSM